MHSEPYQILTGPCHVLWEKAHAHTQTTHTTHTYTGTHRHGRIRVNAQLNLDTFYLPLMHFAMSIDVTVH